jgi:hypothetical protein
MSMDLSTVQRAPPWRRRSRSPWHGHTATRWSLGKRGWVKSGLNAGGLMQGDIYLSVRHGTVQ